MKVIHPFFVTNSFRFWIWFQAK